MVSANYKILIVEDNAADARLIGELLAENQLHSFDTVAVEKWSDAAAQVEIGNFDAAMLDLSLPDSGGLDTLQNFIGFAPDLPVIVTTGQNDIDLGLAAMKQAGGESFL